MTAYIIPIVLAFMVGSQSRNSALTECPDVKACKTIADHFRSKGFSESETQEIIAQSVSKMKQARDRDWSGTGVPASQTKQAKDHHSGSEGGTSGLTRANADYSFSRQEFVSYAEDHFGGLEVQSKPSGASITINGHPLGLTNMRRVLETGEYKLVLTKIGFVDETQGLVISAGHWTTLTTRLKPAK